MIKYSFRYCNSYQIIILSKLTICNIIMFIKYDFAVNILSFQGSDQETKIAYSYKDPRDMEQRNEDQKKCHFENWIIIYLVGRTSSCQYIIHNILMYFTNIFNYI